MTRWRSSLPTGESVVLVLVVLVVVVVVAAVHTEHASHAMLPRLLVCHPGVYMWPGMTWCLCKSRTQQHLASMRVEITAWHVCAKIAGSWWLQCVIGSRSLALSKTRAWSAQLRSQMSPLLTASSRGRSNKPPLCHFRRALSRASALQA